MYAVTYQTFSADQVREYMNLTKDVVIKQLVEDGLITMDKAEEWMRDYHVEAKKPSWVSRLLGKLVKCDDDHVMIVLLKQVNLKPDSPGQDSNPPVHAEDEAS